MHSLRDLFKVIQTALTGVGTETGAQAEVASENTNAIPANIQTIPAVTRTTSI
jgi:hypothetical protein